MNSTLPNLEGVVFLLLILIPWPGPILIKDPCPREKASIVRKVVLKRWLPILEKVGASLPLECPLNPLRDIFHPQEIRKLKKKPQWACGFCGKSFYKEEHLDAHMENRHSTELNQNEDATCLADFCDIMRCEVLQERLRELEEESIKDMEFWNHHLIASKKAVPSDKAVQPAIPRSLMKSYKPWNQHAIPKHKPIRPLGVKPVSTDSLPSTNIDDIEPGEVKKSIVHENCKNSGQDCDEKDEAHNDSEKNSGGSSEEVPLYFLNSWKETCSDEHLAELRAKCQVVIKQCISGLVLNLTIEQVKSIEMALQKTVCWYLTCERYWESGVFEPPDFPWVLVCALVFILTFGLSVVYYIVWVFFESNHESAANTPVAIEPLPLIAPESTVVKRRPQPPTAAITAGGGSQSNSLGRHNNSIVSKSRFGVGESESECRDSGFNEGSLYPELPDAQCSYLDYDQSPSRLRHYSEDSSRASGHPDEANNRYYIPEERMYNYASTFTPNYSQRRLKRNRYNYLDDFDTYSEFDTEENVDSNSLSRERSDSFIYVSYPPEVKKKFMDNR